MEQRRADRGHELKRGYSILSVWRRHGRRRKKQKTENSEEGRGRETRGDGRQSTICSKNKVTALRRTYNRISDENHLPSTRKACPAKYNTGYALAALLCFGVCQVTSHHITPLVMRKTQHWHRPGSSSVTLQVIRHGVGCCLHAAKERREVDNAVSTLGWAVCCGRVSRTGRLTFPHNNKKNARHPHPAIGNLTSL